MEEPDDLEQPIANIVGSRVALGPLRRDVLPAYTRWLNDFAVVRTLDRVPGPATAEDQAAWFTRVSTDTAVVRFTVYERASWRPIGITNLHGIEFRHGTAEFGLMIGETGARGQGFGTEATRLMLDYAFTALGLHNVMLTVFEYNQAGIQAYTNAGFREFGRRRECRMMGGKLWDEVYMECLSTDFESPILGRIFSHDPRP